MIKKNSLKKFNISNKLIYTLVTIFSFVIIGVGVYAFNFPGSPSVMGHSMGELSPPAGCLFGQALSWNGNSWTCVTNLATDARFTLEEGGLCYETPATCISNDVRCINSLNFGIDSVGCLLSQTEMDEACYQQCLIQDYACDGAVPNCEWAGSTYSYPDSISAYCYDDTIYCTCYANGYYYQASSIPAGKRCI